MGGRAAGYLQKRSVSMKRPPDTTIPEVLGPPAPRMSAIGATPVKPTMSGWRPWLRRFRYQPWGNGACSSWAWPRRGWAWADCAKAETAGFRRATGIGSTSRQGPHLATAHPREQTHQEACRQRDAAVYRPPGAAARGRCPIALSEAKGWAAGWTGQCAHPATVPRP